MNFTEGYDAFAKRAYKLSSKLVFVLHNKDDIKNLLVEAIKNGSELSMQPFYDLVSAFAVDLQAKHFGPYFKEFVGAFGVSFKEIKNGPEILQAGYLALSQVMLSKRSFNQVCRVS